MRIRLGQRAKGTTSFGGKLFLSLFFSIFAAVGTLFLIAMVSSAWTMIRTYTWSATPCTIVSSQLNEASGVEGAAGWQVRYRYAVAGREYESTTINRSMWTRNTGADRRLSQHYAPGTTTTCYVNLGAPTEATLFRENLAGLLWVLFPLPFVAIGYGGLYFVWRKPRVTVGGTPYVPPLTSTAAGSSAKGTWIAVIFFGAFGLLGALGTWFLGVKPALRVFDARDWPAVPCTIVSSSVETHDSDDGYTYSVAIVYRYEVGERTFTADRYKFFSGSSSGREGKAAVVARHPPGSAAVCFVNPADPTDAVIERGLTGDMAFGFIPLVFALVGFGGGVGFLMHRSRTRARAIAAAGDVWSRAGLRPALEFNSTRADQGGSETRPTSDSGPVTVETRGSRTGKFIGLLIFALIWNGIVSVFVVTLVNGGWAGFSWFAAIFLVPFVGVGLLVLGLAVHSGLAIFNPHPRLHLSTNALAPGGTLELRWEMLGSTHKLRRFRIALEGREEATYRRGTDTHTDKRVFARIELADVQDPAGIAAGAARVRLPTDAMHSFTAKNNKIVWALHVRGDIPRWPDIDDEFPFTVIAQTGAVLV